MEDIEKINKQTAHKITKTAIAKALIKEKYQTSMIADALEVTKPYVARIRNEELKRKYDLTDETTVRLAFAGAKRILKGKTFGNIKEVKSSDFVAIFREIFDRYHPKISPTVSLNFDFSPIDLSKYYNKQ